MAITSSFNKRTGTRYAYETTYEWDEAAQRKVQRRRCVGHFDPETGEVVPNGGRGRPRSGGRAEAAPPPREPGGGPLPPDAAALASLSERLAALEASCSSLAEEAHSMNEQVMAMIDGRS